MLVASSVPAELRGLFSDPAVGGLPESGLVCARDAPAPSLALQGALPLLAAACIVRPHLVVFYAYIALRVGENVVNHTGLDGRCRNGTA